MPKVYFMGGEYMGCWYVRCFLPLLVNGWSGNYLGLKKVMKSLDLIKAEMMDSDVVVFHRADTPWHHRVAIELKRMGKKIVFDNDDTYKIDETHAFYGIDEKGFKENVRMKNNVINNFIRNCDLITCSTDYLAKEYKQLNPKVKVLPNCVNPDDWDKPLRNTGEKIRIGVVGSTAYYHDFDIIKPLLTKLNSDPQVQLVMFGLHNKKLREENPLVAKTHQREYGFWDTLDNLELVGWAPMVDYFTTLNELRLDIMLIPRRESYFNKCKSNIKFLEAAMCEIPVITNSFPDGPYEEDINNTNGILVKNDQWEEAIEKLKDKKIRLQMGKNAHKYVLKNYNIHNLGHLWEDAYKSL